ncbi:ATP-binding protein [Promethearchaeum syntrophicum]|uniref:ATP-binding protein n=1 Tax=Promethearchaeum syntrophicum TaxID=2594042 RepID=A0AC61ZU32_9ARCH
MEETDVKFKFYSKIFHVNGDELISNDFIAISELVKNSFDAKAKRVEIIYEESKGETGDTNGRFIIEDDGEGMDKDIIIDYWMGVAGDYKEELKKKGKTLLGDKGIGRLAASRISNQLIMITRPKKKNIEYKIKINWNKIFEERYATDYSTKLREYLPENFRKKSGTKLILENIKHKWNETKLKELKNHLSRLINPLNPSIDKKIRLTLPDKYKSLSGYIFSSKIIKTPMYSIKGRIDESGIITFSASCKLIEESRLEEFSNKKEKIQMEKFAKFQFEYRYWDFDDPLLNKLSNIIDYVKTEIRKNIIYHSGISVYRDNFRVMPYGDYNLDWLDLNTRRIKRLSDFIQNDHIIGAISFSSKDNPDLKDQSNREGFDKNIEFQIFKDTVIKTISILERFRHIFLMEIKKKKKKQKKRNKKSMNF